MAKYKKMLSDMDAPDVQSLMRLMETQSVQTIAAWSTAYAQACFLPLWQQAYPTDDRPGKALQTTKGWLAGEVALAEVKKQVGECRKAAREAEGNAVAQGAARTIDAACAAVYSPRSTLGLALYGALTLAYAKLGTNAPWADLECFAAEECAKMEAALQEISVENEPKPANINWYC